MDSGKKNFFYQNTEDELGDEMEILCNKLFDIEHGISDDRSLELSEIFNNRIIYDDDNLNAKDISFCKISNVKIKDDKTAIYFDTKINDGAKNEKHVFYIGNGCIHHTTDQRTIDAHFPPIRQNRIRRNGNAILQLENNKYCCEDCNDCLIDWFSIG